MVVKQKDASMANRMSAIRVDHPSEVKKLIYSQYPQLSEHVAMVTKCTSTLRGSVARAPRSGCLYAAGSCMDLTRGEISRLHGCKFVKALKESLDALTGHFMDDENMSCGVSVFVEENKAGATDLKPISL